MRRIISVTVVLLIAPGGALAQGSMLLRCDGCPSGSLTAPEPRLYTHTAFDPVVIATTDARASQPQQSQSSGQRSWAGRHPALMGLFIGAGAGAVLVASTCSVESDCDLGGRPGAAAFGATFFGGLGALTGWIISVVRR